MRPRISIRGFVRPSVRPSVRRSVRPSVRYTCAKTAFLGCFWPRWDPTLKQMINQHVLRASSITQSFHPSVRPSVSPYMSHDQYTQRHSPDASLPGRACFINRCLFYNEDMQLVLQLLHVRTLQPEFCQRESWWFSSHDRTQPHQHFVGAFYTIRLLQLSSWLPLKEMIFR